MFFKKMARGELLLNSDISVIFIYNGSKGIFNILP